MTILFFSRLFYPHIGGVEKHVLEVGRRLVKKGYRVVVITEVLSTKDIPVYQSKDRSAKVTGEVDGIEIHRIPSRHSGKRSASRISNGSERFWTSQNDGESVALKNDWFKKFRIWLELWKLRNIIKSADIVHCHDIFFWYLPFRFIYFNKPTYTTFHGYETKFPPSKKAIYIRKVSEILSNGSICIGEYLKKWYGTKSDYVTYGAVYLESQKSKVNPFDKLRVDAEQSRSIKSQNYKSKLKILFIGRLEEDIGISIYLKALDILKRREINFEFEACGDGSLRSKAEQYGKVYGFVKDLNQYIEKADIVFASSYLSIMEAMIYKKLVFAVYDNPLKKDYLKMSSFARWIVIEDSPKDLADKILYFINHEDEKDYILSRAYEWVRAQTWDKVTEMYIKLWHSNDTYH